MEFCANCKLQSIQLSIEVVKSYTDICVQQMEYANYSGKFALFKAIWP